MNEILGSGDLNEIVGYIKDFWSRTQVYFTAEVCSNILDLLAFLLVTPEFMTNERRSQINRMVGDVGSLLTRFFSSFAYILIHLIVIFPFVTGMMLGLILILRAIAKSIISAMPYGLALIMKACVIGFAIIFLVFAIMVCCRSRLIDRRFPGLIDRLALEVTRDINVIQGKPIWIIRGIMQYTLIVFICSSLLTFAISIQEQFHFTQLVLTEPTQNFLGYAFMLSFFLFILSAAFYGIAWVLKNIAQDEKKDTFFWIGVGCFVVARALLILRSASDVWIGGVAK